MTRALFLAAVALWAACGASASQGSATGSAPAASAALRLAIQIPRLLHLRVLGQPERLVVTAQDAERGYVVARGLVEVLSTHRHGYAVNAMLAQGPVTEADLEGLAQPLRVDAGGARVAMPPMVGKPRPEPYAVEYRLRLAPGTAAGSYRWPVSLSIQEP
jgi:hypothetical protein